MAIITVQGLINSDEAGLILPHEHILLDLTNQYQEYPEGMLHRLIISNFFLYYVCSKSPG